MVAVNIIKDSSSTSSTKLILGLQKQWSPGHKRHDKVDMIISTEQQLSLTAQWAIWHHGFTRHMWSGLWHLRHAIKTCSALLGLRDTASMCLGELCFSRMQANANLLEPRISPVSLSLHPRSKPNIPCHSPHCWEPLNCWLRAGFNIPVF